MSFLSTPSQFSTLVGASIGNLADLQFNDLRPNFASGMYPLIVAKSNVAGVERLVYDSVNPCYLYNLAYYQEGADAQNVRIRITNNDIFNICDLVGAAPGVADRGGVIWGGPASGATLASIYGAPIPVNRLKIYLTTQFIDGQANIGIIGNLVKVSS